jgi:ketosteroid isomerase-like protein
MRIAELVVIIALAGLGIACGPRKLAAPDASQLMEADRAFYRATAEMGREGWVSYLHPQAVIFPAGRPAIAGLDSIRTYYEATKFDPSQLKWEPVRAELSASGDLGFTHGTWEKPGMDKEGKKTVYRGKYLTVWRRDDDGRWKVVADIGTL